MGEAPGSRPVVGIVPAAGRARRLGGPAASKELAPVYVPPGATRPLPACYRLLHAFSEARIPRVAVVTRTAKADVRERIGSGDGATFDPDAPPLDIRHIEIPDSPSPAYTVAQGTRCAGDAVVALGFPDVLWDGADAFSALLTDLDRTDADAVLGLFPPAADYPTHGVELDAAGRVIALHDPDAAMSPLPAWTLAVWTARFSRHLETAVEMGMAPDSGGEPGLTDVFRSAMRGGLVIRGRQVSGKPFLDVGDPDRLAEARRRAELAARD